MGLGGWRGYLGWGSSGELGYLCAVEWWEGFWYWGWGDIMMTVTFIIKK